MLKVLGLTMVLVAISFLALGIRIFFQKNGKFPNTSVGGNKTLREMGIKCAKHEEILRYRKMMKPKINPAELKIDLR